MRYLTARKRATGKGASGTGTEHHWFMTVSAVALAFLMPVWMIVFGRALGGTYEQVVETFSHPFPAILTGLVLIAGLQHFIKGATMMIEDYWQGTLRKLLIIFVITFSYTLMAAGLFALARIAL